MSNFRERSDMKTKSKPNERDIKIGQNIRAIRKELKMSMTDVSPFIDVSWQQLQKIETGVNRISAGNLSILAEGLELDILRFYEGVKDVKY